MQDPDPQKRPSAQDCLTELRRILDLSHSHHEKISASPFSHQINQANTPRRFGAKGIKLVKTHEEKVMSLEFHHACSYPLAKLLASNYMLYLKTQNYHWNITGMHFYSLHKLFESMYEELAESNDEIAERIAMLGDKVPATFSAFLDLSILDEDQDTVGASEMVRSLLADHEAVAELCQEIIAFAEEQQDSATVDMATVRLAAHEKAAWMLRASLS